MFSDQRYGPKRNRIGSYQFLGILSAVLFASPTTASAQRALAWMSRSSRGAIDWSVVKAPAASGGGGKTSRSFARPAAERGVVLARVDPIPSAADAMTIPRSLLTSPARKPPVCLRAHITSPELIFTTEAIPMVQSPPRTRRSIFYRLRAPT